MKVKPKIIIIGANFAGLTAARQIGEFSEVTLIDPAGYFEFIPNIHELISGVKTPSDLRIEKGELIQHMGHNWLQDRVVALKPNENQVELSSGKQLSYDACIMAVGGINDFQEVPGAAQHAYPFKSVEDCQKIGDRFQTLRIEQKSISVVIVGGGSEGVEGLGELLRYRNEQIELNIHLVEYENRLLPSLSPKVNKEILRLCQNLPVDFHFGLRVEEVGEDWVQLSDGSQLTSDLTIWTGGVKPNPLLAESDLTGSSGSWAAVRPTLQTQLYDNIFIAGDAAEIQGVDSKQAYFAMESGQVAGINASRYLQLNPVLQTFHPISRPYLYSFGDLSCFLIWQNLVVAGNPLSVLKEGIYQKTLIDMQTEDTCLRITELYDQLLPTLSREFGKGWDAFFESPLDFMCRPSIRFL